MSRKHVILPAVVFMTLLFSVATLVVAQQNRPAPAAPGTVTFNTVITKLEAGQKVFCNTISSPDTAAARKACEGQDYIWIEMQHSPLTYQESAALVRVIADAGCIPFIRVPQATQGDIQKATDIGALGIIVPMVETVEEAHNAVWYTKFPVGNVKSPNTKPWGFRSNGGNNARGIWGRDYMTNANNNIMVMIQLETPQGTLNLDRILNEVPGIDIVMIASNDFGMFSGYRDGDPEYDALEKIARETTLKHGKYLAGPSSWQDRPGYTFFQGRRAATSTGYERR
ncbi:HpcH/HpaI aldolase/citrate lyase family protein [Candidatus Latescibacterota bacterium]